MRRILLSALLSLLACLPAGPVRPYGQEIYLGVSPDNRWRVLIRQEVLRRVEDQVFFRYPVYVADIRSGRRFHVHDASPPLVTETERGTFQLDWGQARMDWSADNRFLLLQLHLLKDVWSVFRVDVENRTVRDVTGDVRKGLLEKASKKGWVCESPKVTVAEWIKVHRPVLKLETSCVDPEAQGKDRKPKPFTHWVYLDLEKDEVAKECAGCGEEKALKEFKKEPKPTPTPTATPTDEERALLEEF